MILPYLVMLRPFLLMALESGEFSVTGEDWICTGVEETFEVCTVVVLGVFGASCASGGTAASSSLLEEGRVRRFKRSYTGGRV